MAMMSGIPMMFGCAKLYGPPPPDVCGKVLDSVSGQGIPEVLVQGPNGDSLTMTDENGRFHLMTDTCKDLTFSKDGYQSKDTTMYPDLMEIEIKLEKQSEE